MKRKLTIAAAISLIAVLLSVFALLPAAAAGNAYFIDGADLLSENDENQLASKLARLSEELGYDLVVLTTADRGDISVMDYADDYYDANGYRENGVILVIDMSDRSWHIGTSGEAIDKIGSAWSDIGDSILPALSRGDYASAFSAFADKCEDYITYTPKFPFGKALLISALVGLVIALIITGGWKSQLTSVAAQYGAASYVRDKSFQLSDSRDIFLYRTVTKTPIPQETRSSGPSSGTHVSSSGHTHGGGGGHF